MSEAMNYRSIFLFLLSLTLGLSGKTTETLHRSYDDFAKGSLHGLSLHSQGILAPSYHLENLADIDAPILWDAALGKHGELYIGSGNEGVVYKLGEDGTLSEVLNPGMVMTRALVADKKGRIYAATSPNGVIYRIGRNDEVEEFMPAPGEYIWDMLLGPDGDLYLATGNEGSIFRVDPNAKDPEAVLVYDSEETHITALAFDREGRLWAGTATHGLLICIEQDGGSSRVVYASGEREIRMLLPQEDGSLYFSTFNNPGRQQGAQQAQAQNGASGGNGQQEGNAFFDEDNAPQDNQQKGSMESFFSMTVYADAEDGSTLYRLDPNGFAHRVFYNEGASIYSGVSLDNGSLLLGTGSNGLLFEVASIEDWKRVLEFEAGGEVTAIVPQQEAGKYFLLCSNPGRVYELDTHRRSAGYFDSDVLDLSKASQWGTVQVWTAGLEQRDIGCAVRVGNTESPDRSWTSWIMLEKAGRLFENTAPPARYLQYRIDMTSGDASPVHQVRLFSKIPNIAPTVHSLQVLDSGFEARSFFSSVPNQGIDLSRAMNDSVRSVQAKMQSFPQQVKLFERPGSITIVWRAYDSNEDSLEHSLYLQALNSDQWILLVEDLEQGLFSFNTQGWADGYYRLKAVVSDLPSNPPSEALSGDETSQVFLIDNTPPVVVEEDVRQKNDLLTLTLRAEDSTSLLRNARVRWNGHEFQAVNPVDGMLDGSEEVFKLEIPLEGAGERTVVFEVSDENGNLSTYTYSVR